MSVSSVITNCDALLYKENKKARKKGTREVKKEKKTRVNVHIP